MTDQSIDQVKGDLNQFRRIMRAVEFAADVMQKHDEIKSNVTAYEGRLATIQKNIEGESQELIKLEGRRKQAEETANKHLEETRQKAAQIIKDAELQSEEIRKQCEAKKANFEKVYGEKNDELKQLDSELSTKREEKAELEASIDQLGANLETALSRVKKKQA